MGLVNSAPFCGWAAVTYAAEVRDGCGDVSLVVFVSGVDARSERD